MCAAHSRLNKNHSHLAAPKLYHKKAARVKFFRITYFTCENKKQHNFMI